MSVRQYWEAPVPPLHSAAGTALANSASLTDVNPTPNIVFPANFLDLGTRIELTAYGTFSNTGTPTLLLGFYYGGVAGTALAATTAFTTTTGATNWPWTLWLKGHVRSLGSSGTIMVQGEVRFPTSLTAWTIRPIPETALATVTIDTTAAKSLTVGAQWGTANASNTLTCHELTCEVKG